MVILLVLSILVRLWLNRVYSRCERNVSTVSRVSIINIVSALYLIRGIVNYALTFAL